MLSPKLNTIHHPKYSYFFLDFATGFSIAAAFSARNTANVNATGLTLVMGSNNITWHRVQLWGYKRA